MTDDAAPERRDRGTMPRPMLDAVTRAAVIIVLALLLLGFASLVWTPHPLDRTGLAPQLRGPGLSFVFGTDAAGRDVLSLVMRGLLTSYIVTAVGTALGILAGVPLGFAAAFLGGVADRFVLTTGAVVAAIPALASAAILATLLGPGPINAMAAIGVASTPIFVRVARDAGRLLVGSDYVSAARLAGLSEWDAAMRHAAPALGPVLLAQALVVLGFGVIAEAGLSFAGLAARADGASLGLMLREAQAYLLLEPRLIIVPGFVVVLMAGALHVAARGLRRSSATEPRATERDDALA